MINKPIYCALCFVISLVPLSLVAAPAYSLEKPNIQHASPGQIVKKALTQYHYIALPTNRFSKTGRIKVNTLAWNCTLKQCAINGPWKMPGTGACKALAKRVGHIKSYGHQSAKLNRQQLAQCNAGLKLMASGLNKTPPVKLNSQLAKKNRLPEKSNKTLKQTRIEKVSKNPHLQPGLPFNKKPKPVSLASKKQRASAALPRSASINIGDVNYIAGVNPSGGRAASARRNEAAIIIGNINYISHLNRSASPASQGEAAIVIDNINYISHLNRSASPASQGGAAIVIDNINYISYLNRSASPASRSEAAIVIDNINYISHLNRSASPASQGEAAIVIGNINYISHLQDR
ncbi:hypothetical protein MNBD_GAMMA26-1173 [hydrothermal vent metagenome]|uniref:Uncharacterized protein n=1 Tax=hydrothermal vent metagenome TaxID=652676 RepID=A0A3B1B0S4_9ZZZZ